MRYGTSRIQSALGAAAVVAIAVSGCGGGGGGTSGTGGPSTRTTSAAKGERVLPVPENPITNPATTPGLTITKALVENNVSSETGKDVADHLEIALENTSAKPLNEIEIYFKITDPTKRVSEGYYAKLDGFSIEPGGSRVAHFDETAAKDHFPVNRYSLYYTDKNQLVLDVVASSQGVKPATFTVKKDSGGAEAGVE